MPDNEIASLREEVLKLVEPYKNSTQEIPFLTGELIVMAIIALGNKSVRLDQILAWIQEHSHSVRARARQTGFHERGGRLDELLPGFTHAFNLYNVPIIDVNSDTPAFSDQNAGHTVEEQAARIYLAPCLAPRSGVFRLHDLPAELRLTIYEYALSYSIIAIGARETEYSRLWLYTDRRGFGLPFVKTPFYYTIPLGHARGITGLLRVGDKKARTDAHNIFYSQNCFHLHTPETLDRFIARAPVARLSMLKAISFFYIVPPKQQMRVYETCFARLLKESEMECIIVYAEDKPWFSAVYANTSSFHAGIPRYNNVTQLPGVTTLVKLLAKTASWRIEGDAEEIRSYVEREVAKIRSSLSA